MSNLPITWHGALMCLAFGYLLGSIPFGLIVTRLAGLGDVRKIGSGNIGATNVLRTGKKWAAALTLLFDAGKGAAAVLVAHTYFGIEGAAVAAIAAVLGHIFPVLLRFKGGKGVATFVADIAGGIIERVVGDGQNAPATQAGGWLAVNSPRWFGQYSIDSLLGTLPGR